MFLNTLLVILAVIGLIMLALFLLLTYARGFRYAWAFMIGDTWDEVRERLRDRTKR